MCKKFRFKCPHCGCDTIMDRKKVCIESAVRVVELYSGECGSTVEPYETDDREDEIDMSLQTPLDACCAQCGHHWHSLNDAFDNGAFIKEENN